MCISLGMAIYIINSLDNLLYNCDILAIAENLIYAKIIVWFFIKKKLLFLTLINLL